MPRKFSGPLLPGTTSVRQYNRRNKKYKRGKFQPGMKSLTSKVKAIQLKQCETKYSCQLQDSGLGVIPSFLLHNQTVMLLANCLGTTPGSENPSGFGENVNNRVGDQIIAKGIRFAVWLESVSDRQNVRFGVVAFKYNPQISQFVAGADIASVFWRGSNGAGGNINRFLDQPNTDKITVLKHFKLTNGSANYFESAGSTPPDRQNNTRCMEFYIPLKNHKVNYREDNQAIPQWKDIGLAIYAYNQHDSLLSDRVCIMSASSRLYFKDP